MKNSAGKLTLCGLLLLVLSGCEGQQRISSGLDVGTPAPSVTTKTLADVDNDLSKLTTYRQPDPRMYQYSVDKALQSGKPVVLEFATPGHCTNCDEQLQMLRAMLDKYGDQVLFVHIDQYKNPQAYTAYGVMGDPWTFLIDKQGVVRFEQAGRMLYGEMDLAMQKVL